MTGLKFSAYAFLAALLVMLFSGLFGHFDPPPTTMSSAEEIARAYSEHGDQLLIKACGLIIAVTLYFPACCALSLAMLRMQPRFPLLIVLQVFGGIFALIGPFLAGLVIMTAAIRPDGAPDVVAALNDFAAILIVASTLPAVFQGVGLGVAILKDRTPDPILPKWFAWISIIWGVLAQGGVFSAFFETGSLSSTGLVGFVLPMASLLIWMVAVIIALLRIKPAQWASGEPA